MTIHVKKVAGLAIVENIYSQALPTGQQSKAFRRKN
jgi:hypothetical protein